MHEKPVTFQIQRKCNFNETEEALAIGIRAGVWFFSLKIVYFPNEVNIIANVMLMTTITSRLLLQCALKSYQYFRLIRALNLSTTSLHRRNFG